MDLWVTINGDKVRRCCCTCAFWERPEYARMLGKSCKGNCKISDESHDWPEKPKAYGSNTPSLTGPYAGSKCPTWTVNL